MFHAFWLEHFMGANLGALQLTDGRYNIVIY